jgi:hypothetical protein
LLFRPGGVSALPGFSFRYKYTRRAYLMQQLFLFFHFIFPRAKEPRQRLMEAKKKENCLSPEADRRRGLATRQ